ncbi:transport integral membrane protein [Streptomyces inusitatus]|uniref:Protein YobA n=1 Tax=Streptomyces inusitatus TaxID=68221 RepID=A0A918UKQ9_9ACTN|nr:copper resistance protein CopC [Streptomyces inusitatus]GGZ16934.1 transport integral membrane protein [Streptomyces inusitatus]
MKATTAPHLGPNPARHTPGATSPPRALLAVAVLLCTVLGALLTAAGPAAAHAALTGSDPKDGAVVATAPKEVSLTFSEQIAMGKDSIRVLGPGGERADRATVRDLSQDGTVRYAVDLRTGLSDGTYTVAWQAVSADSHPVSGAFTFSVGAPSETSVSLPSGEAGGGAVGLLYDIARYAAYTGFTLMVGAAAFILLCWRRGASVRPLQRLVAYGWVTLTAATLAMLLLRGPYTRSGGLSDVFDLSGLPAVLESRTGAALVSRLLLLGAASLFIAVLFGSYAKQERAGLPGLPGEAARQKDLTFGLAVGGTVVATGIAATWALSEHASTGIQTGLAMPLDILHLLAVACWLGGLAALLTALHRAPSIEASAVRRFSRVAFISVVVLAATGIYQSWRQIGSWSALTGTPYGQLLLTKAVLVALMVGVAWFSRKWTARLGDAPEPADGPDAPDAPEPAGVADLVSVPAAAETTGTGGSAAEEKETGGTTAQSGPDEAPERVAQLARQRAALDTARLKKARDADPDRAGLRRSVLAEASVAVVVLVVTTVLTATEPGRTTETAAKAGGGGAPAAARGPAELKLPFDTGGPDGRGTVRLTLDPARSGGNELHLRVESPDGKPMDVPEAKVSLTLREQRIGPLPVTAERLSAGHWSAKSIQIPMPGEWTVQVTVRTSDIDQTTIDETVRIG